MKKSLCCIAVLCLFFLTYTVSAAGAVRHGRLELLLPVFRPVSGRMGWFLITGSWVIGGSTDNGATALMMSGYSADGVNWTGVYAVGRVPRAV